MTRKSELFGEEREREAKMTAFMTKYKMADWEEMKHFFYS